MSRRSARRKRRAAWARRHGTRWDGKPGGGFVGTLDQFTDRELRRLERRLTPVTVTSQTESRITWDEFAAQYVAAKGAP